MMFDPNLMALPGETAPQWARRTGYYSIIRICQCCLIIEANGDPCGQDDCATCADGGLYQQSYDEGWQGAPFTVTLGAFTDECGHDLSIEADSEAHSEGCERHGFCAQGCDLCGDPHHGDKHAAVIWPREIPSKYLPEGN